MENRFNGLTSKEWLPFQKSWSIVESDEQLYRENVRFFTMPTLEPRDVFYYGPNIASLLKVAESENLNVVTQFDSEVQFAIIDVRLQIQKCESPVELQSLKSEIERLISVAHAHVIERRFICVLADHANISGQVIPFAWDIGKAISERFSLKDEKILCRDRSRESKVLSGTRVEYALYGRKDSSPQHRTDASWDIKNFITQSELHSRSIRIPSWFVLKPAPRKKGEVLHPAKYPEELAKMFIDSFSEFGENVLDPMSGTGSTQIAAVQLGRNGYGTELSEFFAELANERLSEVCNPSQGELFEPLVKTGNFRIEQADARAIPQLGFPVINYVCTSPPYWDMLNMKGAENQARRLEQGLQTNYSSDPDDLGNIEDYGSFLDQLTDVYFGMFSVMAPGSYFTFVVKNIKKQGQFYPFAWDLCHRLLGHSHLVAEHFWLQDDLSIAPYGYGNTWVSNTFHQYCVTVRLR